MYHDAFMRVLWQIHECDMNCWQMEHIFEVMITQKSVMTHSCVCYGKFIMGWLRLVGSLKLYVSFAEYRLFYRALSQKRPIILRSLLIEATPYHSIPTMSWHIHAYTMANSWVWHALSTDWLFFWGIGWRRVTGCLIFIGHFRKRAISGSFAKNDLQLKASCGFSPPYNDYGEIWNQKWWRIHEMRGDALMRMNDLFIRVTWLVDRMRHSWGNGNA